MNRRRTLLAEATFATVLAGCALFLALSPIWDADTFFHVVVGRWIVDHRSLPGHDVWSAVDPTRAYVPPHWLFDVVAALLDRWHGLEAVRLGTAGVITATFVGFYVVLRRLGYGPMLSLLLGAALLISFHARMRPRPHVINLAAEIAIMAYVVRLRSARARHAVPVFVVFFLWSCLHNGAAWLGVAALAALVFTSFTFDRASDPTRTRRALLTLTLAAGLGWLLNPASLASLATFNFGELSGIGEWRHWPDASASLDLYWVLTRVFPPLALVLWAIDMRGWWKNRRGDIVYELVLAGFWIALSFWAIRFFYLSVLAIVLIYAARQRSVVTRRRHAGPMMAVATLFLIVVTFHYEAQFYPSLLRSRGNTVDQRFVPVVLTQLLAESGIEARVATNPHWGSYVLYVGWPRLTVTVDGRNAAREDVMSLTHDLERVRPGDPEDAKLPWLYSALPADFLLMPAPVFRPGVTGEWLSVASMPPAELWVRRSERIKEWLPRLSAVADRHRTTP